MNFRIAPIIILLCSLLSACNTSTPEPITAATDSEFILSVGQTVTLAEADLSITLVSVPGDARCPSEIECAASGPVTIQLSIRDAAGQATEETLETFTDYKGMAPTMTFEGIKSSTVIDGLEVRILGVSPYPKERFDEIKPSEYRVTLKVTRHE